MNPQISLRSPSQLPMKSLVVGIWKFVIKRSDKTGLARHSAMAEGSLPSASNSSRSTSGCLVWSAMRSISACTCSSGKWPLPVILQRLRVAQIVFYFLFKLRPRNHFIERRLCVRPLLWPYPMTPVNSLDGPLIRHTLLKCQPSIGMLRRIFRMEESQHGSSCYRRRDCGKGEDD